jgi:hypothetical protein
MTGPFSARFEQGQRLLDTGGHPPALTDDRGQLHQRLRGSPGRAHRRAGPPESDCRLP